MNKIIMFTCIVDREVREGGGGIQAKEVKRTATSNVATPKAKESCGAIFPGKTKIPKRRKTRVESMQHLPRTS